MPSIPSLQEAIGAFIVFLFACCAIGRPDIPLKLVTELRTKALAGTSASWDCPSAFHKDACSSYDSKRYK